MVDKLFYPDENKTWKWVLQWHSRGKSCHGDLRLQIDPDRLIGWTLNLIKGIPSEPKNYAQALGMVNKVLGENIKLLLDPNKKIVTEEKMLEPINWLTIDKASFPAGTVGATKNKMGFMGIIDNGTVEFGATKSYYHEYFLKGTKISGKLVIRQLPNVWKKISADSDEPSKTGEGYTVWMSFFADPDPYVLSKRAVKEKWYPPKNISALPKTIRKQIPENYRYWEEDNQIKAHKMRDELVSNIKNLSIKYEENFYIKENSKLEEYKETKKKEPWKEKRRILTDKQQEKLKLENISKISVPSKEVIQKIRETLFYDPPESVKFHWVLGEGGDTPNSLWMEQHTPFTIKTLPTYPGQGKTGLQGTLDPNTLYVEFPDGVKYKILPETTESLYKSDWVKRAIGDKWALQDIKKQETFGSILLDELIKNKDMLKSVLIDFQNMDKIDKAFSFLDPGQPTLKDIVVARKQAAKEIYDSINPKDLILGNVDAQLKKGREINSQITARSMQILSSGQLKEIEEQLSGMENFLLEVGTSTITAGASKRFYEFLRKEVRDLKYLSDIPLTDIPGLKQLQDQAQSIIRKAFTKATISQIKLLDMEIAKLAGKITSFGDLLELGTLKSERWILDLIEDLIQFWKDTVLIFTPGTAVRNMTDNAVKAINESLNTILEGKLFNPFMSSKNTIIPIPKELMLKNFGQDAAGAKILNEMERKGMTAWNKLREFLYENLLVKPELASKRGFYIGRVTQYQKEVFNARRNLVDFDDLIATKALKDVNRVFFDYANKMELEVSLAKISPFITFNARNFNYWLKDFMYHPWKMGAIRGAWDWWTKITGDAGFIVLDKLPMYLMPGTYFQPLSWLSAFKFIRFFAQRYRGDPEWMKARDAHIQFHISLLNKFNPENRMRVFSKADIKGIEDYLERQKGTMTKLTVDTWDEWIGLNPVLKKVLAELHLAEKEEWKKVFPQGPLIDAAVGWIIGQIYKNVDSLHSEYFGAISPPGTQTLGLIYKIMERDGIPTEEQINEEIEKRKAGLTPEKKEIIESQTGWLTESAEREKIKKELTQRLAREVDRAWKVQQLVTGYLTGMWLTRSWADIYRTHRNIIEELGPPEGYPDQE